MTEAEWNVCEDPAAMIDEVTKRISPYHDYHVSDRKLRLFACACCRQVWHLLTGPRSRKAVEVAERYADGLATEGEIRSAWEASNGPPGDYANWAGHLACNGFDTPYGPDVGYVLDSLTSAVGGDSRITRTVHAALLREIVGNPFRKTDPAMLYFWQEIHAQYRPLAQAAYDERLTRKCERCGGMKTAVYPTTKGGSVRLPCDDCYGTGRISCGTLDPDRLAVLSDALEDVGCTHEDILAHLRSPGPHYRGCWAVDLLLGKE